MKQATMVQPGKIEYSDVPVPRITADQVLVKIRRIGICGSDIHVFHGKHPFTSYPIVQGHEVSGEIAEVGANVKEFKKGDIVTIVPQVFCGKCYPCTHGQYHICDSLKVLGFQTMGTGAEYFATTPDKVLKTEKITDINDIALVEPTAVAVHAVGRVGDVKGMKILIFGAGPIGNLVGQTAKALGADKVMIVDVSDYRLELALKCNIDYAVNSKKEDIGKAIIQNLGEEKADFIFDCAGVNATMDAAVSYARKGTDIVVVAVFGDRALVDLGLVQDRELRLIGTLMYKQEDFLKAIELIGDNKINTKILITNTFGFDDFLKAYEYIEEQKDKAMKVIVTLD